LERKVRLVFFFMPLNFVTIRQARFAHLFSVAATVVFVIPPPAHGQGSILKRFNIISPERGGIQFHGVTVFGSYYSGYSPYNQNLTAQDENAYAGASTSLGWSTSGPKSSASFGYGVSYMRVLNDTGFSSSNHSLSFGWNRRISQKWGFTASAAGVVNNVEQLLFNPTPLSNAATLPATLDELSAAMQAGSFSDSEFASMLTGAAVLSTPERTFPYGARTLSVSMNIGMSYRPTERTSISLGFSGARTQRLVWRDGVSDDSAIPYTSAGLASFSWSHLLSPRTSIAVSAGTTRSFSRFQDAYVSRADFSSSRTLSPRWFVQGRVGTGYIVYTRQTFVAPTGLGYSAGGAIGFRTTSHTFLAAIGRSVSDGYGLGAGATLSATGAWNWRRRASPWSVSGSAGYQQLQGSILGRLESWTAGVSLARSLGTHLFVSVQYGYSELPTILTQPELSQSGARVALTWSPAARQ
jgi:hypothetical protein